METLRISRSMLVAMLLAVITFADGCRVVEGIFKAGVWVGIIIAVVVIGVIIAFVRAIGS